MLRSSQADRVNAVAICPNKKCFATANADDNVRLYHLTPKEVRSGEERREATS